MPKRYMREKQTQNIVIREIQEQSDEAFSLVGNMTKFFEDRFAMCDIMICRANRSGQKQLGRDHF